MTGQTFRGKMKLHKGSFLQPEFYFSRSQRRINDNHRNELVTLTEIGEKLPNGAISFKSAGAERQYNKVGSAQLVIQTSKAGSDSNHGYTKKVYVKSFMPKSKRYGKLN